MGPGFRACLGGVGLVTVVLVACGGKVLEDSGSVTFSGPTKGVGGSSASSGSSGSSSTSSSSGFSTPPGFPTEPPDAAAPPPFPPPYADAGPSFPSPPDGGAERADEVIAYASPGPQGVATNDNVHAAFFPDGRLYGYDLFYPIPPDPTAFARGGWAFGSPTLNGSRVYYAIGHQLPPGRSAEDFNNTLYEPGGAGAIVDARVSSHDAWASCSVAGAAGSCNIQVTLHRGPDRAVKFFTDAKVDGAHIVGDGYVGKSRLRGAFTCDDGCRKGYAGNFGMIFAFAIEDDQTGEMLYGAASLASVAP